MPVKEPSVVYRELFGAEGIAQIPVRPDGSATETTDIWNPVKSEARETAQDMWDRLGTTQTAQTAIDTRLTNTEATAIAYEDRAAFLAATIPAPVMVVSWLSNGQHLSVQRDASGTIAQADGTKWKPLGGVYPDHFAENTVPGTTDMLSAMHSALAASGVVQCFGGVYYFSNTIVVNGHGQEIHGAETHGSVGSFGTRFEFDPSTTGDAIRFARDDPNTQTLNQSGIKNIELAGGSNALRTGWAINCQNCNHFRLESVVWEGFYNGLVLQGGQNYFLDNWQHLSGGTDATISGTAALRIKQWDRTDISGHIAIYKVFCDGFTIAGGTNFGTEFGVDVLFDDNNNFTNGYISRCGLSTVKLGGGAYNVFKPQFTNVYCDQVKFQAAGGDHLIYVPPTGAGLVSGSFTNCVFGQSSGAALNMTNTNAVAFQFSDVTFANCDGGFGTISGADSVQMSDIRFATGASGLTLSTIETVQLSGLIFDTVTTGAPLTISGTVTNLSYDKIDLISCAANISVTATGWSRIPRASWYRRGTWIPTFTFSTTSDATYTAKGEYSITGDRVDFSVNVTFTNLGASAGSVRFSLPETPGGGRSRNNVGIVAADNLIAGIGDSMLSWQVTPGGSTARIYHQSGGTRSGLLASEMTATTIFELSGFYFLDAV